jgi:hypothetical protein
MNLYSSTNHLQEFLTKTFEVLKHFLGQEEDILVAILFQTILNEEFLRHMGK